MLNINIIIPLISFISKPINPSLHVQSVIVSNVARNNPSSSPHQFRTVTFCQRVMLHVHLHCLMSRRLPHHDGARFLTVCTTSDTLPMGSSESTAVFTSRPTTSPGARGRGCAGSDRSSTNECRGWEVARGEGSRRRRDLVWPHASLTRAFV